MATYTVNVPQKSLMDFKSMIESLGLTYHKSRTKKQVSPEKREILDNIDAAFAEFRLIQEGEATTIKAEDVFNEL